MSIERINPETMRKLPGISQVVRVGDTVYITGQGPVDMNQSVIEVGDADAQATDVYHSMGKALQAAGGDLNNLVKITAYITRPEYYSAVVRARERFLGPKPAASSTVIIPALSRPNMLIEIEAIAVVGATGATKESIDPPQLHKPPGHAHLVKVGNVVYISGLIGWRKGGTLARADDAQAQAQALYDNMDICLEAAGATRNDIVKTTTFYTHPFYYESVRKARESYYGPNPPTSAAVVVTYLANPDAVLEIEAIAVLGEPKQHLNPETMNRPKGYTHIVKVGDTAYIAGQIALDSQGDLVAMGDPEGQLRQVYANLEAALKAIGGTRNNMVKTTTYFTRTDYFASVGKARQEFYGNAPPTSTAAITAGLAHPDWLVEIEAIAAVD